MTQALPRTNLNSSRLLRSLSDMHVTDVLDANPASAERLGQWLKVADAIALFAALNPGPTPAVDARPSVKGSILEEACAQVRNTLAKAIRADAVFRTSSDVLEGGLDFSAYRRAYFTHQRNMTTSVGPLRGRVRVALSNRSGALKRLAALDAALDQALANRERELLTSVPTLLEKRFEAMRKAHEKTPVETPENDTSASPIPAGTKSTHWLALFNKKLLDVLLAELDLRLQPIEGLIAEYLNEQTKENIKG